MRRQDGTNVYVRGASQEVREAARGLRQNMTPAESRLWAALKRQQLAGLKFRRQHAVGRFILDFYCAECRLVIELDGDSHSDQRAYDEVRTRELNKDRLKVLRFDNPDVFEHLDVVLEAILESCLARTGKRPAPPPSPLSTGERE